MVYGIPDVGLDLCGAAGAPAKVKVSASTDDWNDDFCMVYGIPDINGRQNPVSVSVVHLSAWDSGDPLE